MSRIIAFADARYLPVARNWLAALQALDLGDQALLVTLDDETRRALPPENVMHRPLAMSGGLAALWRHRIEVFRELLDAGEAFIHSDADALFVQDPRPAIAACDAEMVFSQGTIWPPDVHQKHRVVVCCGFFHLSATPRTRAFVDAVAQRMQSDGDDQIAVNRVIDDMIEGWNIHDPYEIPFKDTTFLASRSAMTAVPKPNRGDAPGVSVLAHHAFPRLVSEIDDQVIVAHPLSGKTCAEKRSCLMDLGLWTQPAEVQAQGAPGLKP